MLGSGTVCSEPRTKVEPSGIRKPPKRISVTELKSTPLNRLKSNRSEMSLLEVKYWTTFAFPALDETEIWRGPNDDPNSSKEKRASKLVAPSASRLAGEDDA